MRNATRHEVGKAGQNCTVAKVMKREDGRVGQSGNAKTDQKIARLTSSLHEKTRLSSDDLSDRMAMLGDVTRASWLDEAGFGGADAVGARRDRLCTLTRAWALCVSRGSGRDQDWKSQGLHRYPTQSHENAIEWGTLELRGPPAQTVRHGD